MPLMNKPKTIKLKWKNSDAPTGRFRSFHKRGWPTADIAGTDIMAVMLSCEVSYSKAAVDAKSHGEIKVSIADRRKPNDPAAGAWVWRTLKERFHDLESAKATATRFVLAHPEFFPELETM